MKQFIYKSIWLVTLFILAPIIRDLLFITITGDFRANGTNMFYYAYEDEWIVRFALSLHDIRGLLLLLCCLITVLQLLLWRWQTSVRQAFANQFTFSQIRYFALVSRAIVYSRIRWYTIRFFRIRFFAIRYLKNKRTGRSKR